MGKESGGSHTIMPKKLAQALMEAGMQHFDAGGTPQPQPIQQQYQGLPSQTTTQTGGAGGRPTDIGSIADMGGDLYSGNISGFTGGLGGMVQGFSRDLTAQNNYVANAPDISRQNFFPAIQTAQAQQGSVYNQQQNLAQTLLNQSNGYGPNPAQAQLAQNTGQNVSQQAALMAAQRGASANPALIARQAAQQGANIQQNSVGQAAALQAQQQLGAQQALQQQQNAMANQALQREQIQQGGLAAQNTAVTTGELGAQGINATTAGQNAAAINGTTGSIFNMAGQGASMISSMFNKGGKVKGYADGGDVPDDEEKIETPTLMGTAPAPLEPVQLSSNFAAPTAAPAPATNLAGLGIQYNPQSSSGGGGGGGGLMGMAALLSKGGNVAGKAQTKGDSPKNDTVPALLSPGEVVIDKETLADKGEVGKAARLVAQAIEKKNKGSKGKGDDKGSAKAAEFMKHLKPQKKGYGGVLESRSGGC